MNRRMRCINFSYVFYCCTLCLCFVCLIFVMTGEYRDDVDFTVQCSDDAVLGQCVVRIRRRIGGR